MIDVITGDRLDAVIPADLTSTAQIGFNTLSPDGFNVVAADWTTGESQLIDLRDGTADPLEIQPFDDYGEIPVQWAPDSSGVFTLEAGDIVFVDRATGQSTTLPIEFDDVDAFTSIDLRTVT